MPYVLCEHSRTNSSLEYLFTAPLSTNATKWKILLGEKKNVTLKLLSISYFLLEANVIIVIQFFVTFPKDFSSRILCMFTVEDNVSIQLPTLLSLSEVFSPQYENSSF